MNAGIIRGCEAAAAENVPALGLIGGCQIHCSADGITRALWSSQQFQLYPVMAVVIDVAQQGGRRIDVIQDNIDLAVVKQITKSGAARGNNGCKPRAFDGRYKLELLS